MHRGLPAERTKISYSYISPAQFSGGRLKFQGNLDVNMNEMPEDRNGVLTSHAATPRTSNASDSDATNEEHLIEVQEKTLISFSLRPTWKIASLSFPSSYFL
jgi:hypothetical protein